jgi:hypothetical protein
MISNSETVLLLVRLHSALALVPLRIRQLPVRQLSPR